MNTWENMHMHALCRYALLFTDGASIAIVFLLPKGGKTYDAKGGREKKREKKEKTEKTEKTIYVFCHFFGQCWFCDMPYVTSSAECSSVRTLICEATVTNNTR
jgi:hypothetical protein